MNLSICNYCLNRYKDVCAEECQSEGKYRHLEPEPLPDWELPPELPPYREMVDLLFPEVRAVIWLHAYYLDPQNRNGNRS